MTDDILSQALSMMRVTGSLLLVEYYTPPWGISIPGQTELSNLLHTRPGTLIIAFHFVHQGCFTLCTANGEEMHIHANEAVVGFGGLAHTIGQGQLSAPVTLEAHLNGMTHRFCPLAPAEPHKTGLICGVFMLRDSHLNPLVAALPSFLHVTQTYVQENGPTFAIPTLLANELKSQHLGSDYTVQRLLELFCVESIRCYLDRSNQRTASWLRGIQDPLLGRALHAFHQAPGEHWSVARLAAEVNLSPSRFAARFVEAFAETPMVYVTKWRLNVAREMLNSAERSVDEIAHYVGYENLPAFIRTFKRYIGLSPAAWRTSQQ